MLPGMTITIDWPEALRPASVEWELVTPQLIGRSAFDGSAEADTLGAARWGFTITTGAMKRSEVPEWEAFIGRLRGMVNRARCWDWRREGPIGVATGAPTVRVATTGFGGASLELQGWTAGVAGILRAGSYLGINGELKRLSQTINSDGSGRSTISFEPPLRAPVAAATPVFLVKPTALFIMTSPAPSWKQEGGRVPTQTMSFQEDLRP